MTKILYNYIYPGLQDIHHIWISGSPYKSKDYIGRVKRIFDKIQINLEYYRNIKVLTFFIWTVFILSIAI